MVTLNIKKILIAGLLLTNLISLGCANHRYYNFYEPRTNVVTVTGTLVSVVAIGGETTGWGVELDSPLELGGKELSLFEVVPSNKGVDGFEDRRVEITGTLQKRYGVERKGYWVILINKIRLINKEVNPF